VFLSQVFGDVATPEEAFLTSNFGSVTMSCLQHCWSALSASHCILPTASNLLFLIASLATLDSCLQDGVSTYMTHTCVLGPYVFMSFCPPVSVMY
jgi:hypothetical protein